MTIFTFKTVEQGLEALKEEYFNGEVSEGEFADDLVNNFTQYFCEIDPLIAFRAIQEFREYDYEMEDEPKEVFGGKQAYTRSGRECGFIHDRKIIMLPKGTRIGIRKNNGLIDLDWGVVEIGFSGLPNLKSMRQGFKSYVGEWIDDDASHTGENRPNGTVYYNDSGLYWYEFANCDDAYGYLFENVKVPYAIQEYDSELSAQNGEETFGPWSFENGFNPMRLNPELIAFMEKNIATEAGREKLIEEIHDWHDNCEAGTNGECAIYDAIDRGASDEELILIAFDVDRDLFDKFKKQFVKVSGYFKEDEEEFEDYLACIGTWDEESNDDDIFFYFENEASIVGDHDDFVITSYTKDEE